MEPPGASQRRAASLFSALALPLLLNQEFN
jgi:hypothetical protein